MAGCFKYKKVPLLNFMPLCVKHLRSRWRTAINIKSALMHAQQSVQWESSGGPPGGAACNYLM